MNKDELYAGLLQLPQGFISESFSRVSDLIPQITVNILQFLRTELFIIMSQIRIR